MSQQLWIDGFAFARDGRVLEGTLAVSELERLQDLLAGVADEIPGEVRFRLQGMKDEHGHSQLRVTASGVLPLSCQRCLKAIDFAVEVDSLLELVPDGAGMSQDELEDDSKDFLPVAGELDVAELVEDEILLALPVAPRHEKCGLPGAAEAGERISPFAALATLKGKPN